MIKSFKDSETENVFMRRFSKKLPHDIQKTAFRKLRLIDAAGDLNDLRVPPANRLEALGADRKGRHSIRMNDQWRVCFIWKDGDAYEVEIMDYR
jgi:proteic killer suppression protein